MDKFNSPDPIIFDGNIREHWKRWKQELQLYLGATEKGKKENKVKSSFLLSYIGPQGREIYHTFIFWRDKESFYYNDIVPKFENFFVPRQNIALLRYKFLTYKQKEGQRFDKFMSQLKKTFSDCEFGELKNSLIKDIAVIGVISNSLKERILRGQNLTLRKAIALRLSAKEMKIYGKELKQQAGIYRIKFNKKENRYSEPPKI